MDGGKIHALAEQVVREDTLDAKAFIMAFVRIILHLAIAEIVTAVLVFLTGTGALNVLFYAYALLQVFRFLQRILASDRYILMQDRLILQRRLGETVTKEVSVPLEKVSAIREHIAAERLNVSYAHVDVFLRQTEMPVRVRLAQIIACLSARLARRAAGTAAGQAVGLVIAYRDGEKAKACVFEPDAGMMGMLTTMAGDLVGVDDRMGRPYLKSFTARSLARAFPEQYPHVQSLITPEDLKWADERQAERQKKRDMKRAQTAHRQELAERRRAAEQREAERKREAKAKQAKRKKARKYRDEDILPEEPDAQAEEPRMMEIPDHPEVVEIEYDPVKTVGRKRRGSRRRADD